MRSRPTHEGGRFSGAEIAVHTQPRGGQRVKGYVERFRKVVEEVEANPALEVVTFKVKAPAKREELRAAEEVLGAKLAEPLRRFYGEANGLHLHWRVREDLGFEETKKLQQEFDDYPIQTPEDTSIPFAQIHLLGLLESLKKKRWPQLKMPASEDLFEFQGQSYDYNEFGKRLRPFDIFTAYECMAFLLEEGVGDPKLMLLTDYYAEWDETRITDFDSYMEFLLATRGISEARKKFFAESHGDRKPPLKTGPRYWTPARTPKLFRGQKKKR
jgi:hypothetical protein